MVEIQFFTAISNLVRQQAPAFEVISVPKRNCVNKDIMAAIIRDRKTDQLESVVIFDSENAASEFPIVMRMIEERTASAIERLRSQKAA